MNLFHCSYKREFYIFTNKTKISRFKVNAGKWLQLIHDWYISDLLVNHCKIAFSVRFFPAVSCAQEDLGGVWVSVAASPTYTSPTILVKSCQTNPCLGHVQAGAVEAWNTGNLSGDFCFQNIIVRRVIFPRVCLVHLKLSHVFWKETHK